MSGGVDADAMCVRARRDRSKTGSGRRARRSSRAGGHGIAGNEIAAAAAFLAAGRVAAAGEAR